MAQYHYETLADDEIRLLYLEPGRSTEVLKADLQHVSSASLPTYETVSYCWGDVARSEIIEIGGKTLAIPKGTAQALLRFRDPYHMKTLWIDAVCINQDDLTERSVHVAKMHKIYASGEKNLIWIGEDDGTVADAIRDMDIVFEEMKQDTDDFKTFPMPGDADYYHHFGSGLKTTIDLTPLMRLCSRPWFGRLWVVQEAALAPENSCWCGDHTFDLITFLRVARWLWMKRNYLTLGPFSDTESAFVTAGLMFKIADKEFGYYQVGSRQKSFDKNDWRQFAASPTYWLLVGLQEFACRQPIDHVYGLLGLYQQLSGNDQLPELLQPGPSKSVSEVFTDATRLAILEGSNLLPLLAVYRRENDSQESIHLPSWVPSWHQAWTPDLDPHPLSRDYQATGDRALSVAPQSQELVNELAIQGILVDGPEGAKVTVVVPNEFVDIKSPTISSHFDALEGLLRSHPKTRETANVEKTVAKVLCAGMNAATKAATDDDLLGYTTLKHANKSSPPNEFNVDPNTTQYAAALKRAYHRRRLFITASGRAGLGPSTMRKDDVVAILYGGKLSFVLRRAEQKYELVGPCYLDGVMEGQALKEHEGRGDEEVWFRIQ